MVFLIEQSEQLELCRRADGVFILKPKQLYVFQVSRPYLGFCSDPKHFIVNFEENVVKCAEKWGEM